MNCSPGVDSCSMFVALIAQGTVQPPPKRSIQVRFLVGALVGPIGVTEAQLVYTQLAGVQLPHRPLLCRHRPMDRTSASEAEDQGSTPCGGISCSRRPMERTPDYESGNRGSNPLGSTRHRSATGRGAWLRPRRLGVRLPPVASGGREVLAISTVSYAVQAGSIPAAATLLWWCNWETRSA